jgi:hypothetical protein
MWALHGPRGSPVNLCRHTGHVVATDEGICCLLDVVVEEFVEFVKNSLELPFDTVHLW